MQSRRSKYLVPLTLVMIVLIAAISGCGSGNEDLEEVWKLAEGTSTAVAESGEATPIPVQYGEPVPASIITPITAIVYETTTEYSVTLGFPVDLGNWSKANLCGDSRVEADEYRLIWNHPHPPCDKTSNHADQSILFTVEIPTYHGGIPVECTYRGAAQGTGEPCTWAPLQ